MALVCQKFVNFYHINFRLVTQNEIKKYIFWDIEHFIDKLVKRLK